jgi:hypothetical protein
MSQHDEALRALAQAIEGQGEPYAPIEAYGTLQRYIESQREAEQTMAALEGALRTCVCTHPWRGDNGTVGECVDSGHCGCDNKVALSRLEQKEQNDA